jgi:phosphate transport system substrate-binding protein
MLVVSLVLLGSGGVAVAQVAVDPALKPYEQVSGVSGNLNSIGSDTLNNLMTLWAEGFRAIYPNVNIQIEGKGSSTAPPALIEGTAQLGPMSREMKSTEIDAFEKKYGHKPTQVKVAIDAIGVFVHKDNPIKGLTLEQIDGIFFEHEQTRWQADQYLGRLRAYRRMGQPSALDLWPQQCVWYLRLL